MNIPIEILLLTSCAGAVQSAFFGIYLFTLKRGRHLTTLLLGLLLLAFAVRMVKSVIYSFSEGHAVPELLQNLGYGANLAILPLLWLYLKAYLTKDYQFQWLKDCIHFLPSATVMILSPFITSYFWMNQHGYTYSLLLMGAYLPFCFYVIYKHLRSVGKIQQVWILGLATGITLVWAGYTANFIFHLVPYVTAPILFTVVIYGMSFLALRQGSVFIREIKSQSVVYPRAELERCFENLQHAMVERKLYKDPQLTLPRLAKVLGVSVHVLSATINRRSGQNFSDFVNGCRIEESKRMLESPEHGHQKIAVIAFEVGFNSLSAFNGAFKKVTQMTPSEYRKASQG